MRIDTYVLGNETYVNSQTATFCDRVNLISFKFMEYQESETGGQNGP